MWGVADASGPGMKLLDIGRFRAKAWAAACGLWLCCAAAGCHAATAEPGTDSTADQQAADAAVLGTVDSQAGDAAAAADVAMADSAASTAAGGPGDTAATDLAQEVSAATERGTDGGGWPEGVGQADAGSPTDASADAADPADSILSDAAAAVDTADLADAAPPDAAASDLGGTDSDSQPTDLTPDPTVYTPVAESADPSLAGQPGLWVSTLVACPVDGPTPAGKLVDVATPAGIDLDRPDTWPPGSAFDGYPVREGGGQAVADFNGDGRLDIYFAVATGDNWLYLAQPGEPWKFKGFPVQNGVQEEVSAVAADLDGDNDLDLLVGGNGMRLYRNDGPSALTGVAFTDVSAQAGLEITFGYPMFAAAVGDLDRDGWLDVLISAHRFEQPIPGPNDGQLFAPLLLRGLGGMKFQNVSPAFAQQAKSIVYSASLVDLDGDGDQDAYIGNDFGALFGPNELLRNDLVSPGAPIKMSNKSALSGADIAGNTMGTALGDFDRDGAMDIFFTGWQTQNSLLHNVTQPGGPLKFDNVAAASSFYNGPGFASWGAQAVDVDGDGWLDIAIPNGHLTYGSKPGGGELPPGGGKADGGGTDGGSGGGPFGGGFQANPASQPDNLFHNNGNGTYTDIGKAAGFAHPDEGRALSVGDLDRDGFPDLVLGSVYGKPHLYRNGCSADKSWLHVRLKGKGGNRYGIGARITVVAEGVTYIRDIEAGSTSIWCSGEPAALFGTGTASSASLLSVTFPSGKVQTYADIPLRRRIIVTEL